MIKIKRVSCQDGFNFISYVLKLIRNEVENLEAKNIVNVLENLKGTIAYKKIFINGAWGIGKSFYANKYTQSNRNNTIYISVFGKESINDIEKEILSDLIKKHGLLSKIKHGGREILEAISTSVSYKGFNISIPSIDIQSTIKLLQKNLDDKKIMLIIDDIERKSQKLSIIEIMGLVEKISLCDNVKIVLIGDESKINSEEFEKWDSFKEKIIEKEYFIDKFSNDAVNKLVLEELSNYILEDDLISYVNEFVEKYRVKNLRTIIKSVGLFLEIVEIHLNEKYDKDIYMAILKNCFSVVNEWIENIFEPKECENEKKDFITSLDENICTRIERHYFNSMFGIKKDTIFIVDTLNIFLGRYDESTIENYKDLIKTYNLKEKNIFYGSSEQIINEISKVYNSIINKTYIFTTFHKLEEDVCHCFDWGEIFDLNFDEKKLKENAVNILLNNYYDNKKDIYNNQISQISLHIESEKMIDIVNTYNDEVNQKYYFDLIKIFNEKFKKKEYDYLLLSKIKEGLSKKEVIIIFMNQAKDNNYYIPNLESEISEEDWSWTHSIWSLYFEQVAELQYKEEVNEYAEKIKEKNKLTNFRIKCLQDKKPLVKVE